MPANDHRAQFLDCLLGSGLPAPHKAVVFTLPGEIAVQISTPAEATQRIEAVHDLNVYLGVYVVDRLQGSGRGGIADTSGLLALGADVDYGVKDNGKLYPPTADDAAAIARLRLEPTMIVSSGGGLHAWWVLDEPWLFSGDLDIRVAERASAMSLSSQWSLRLRQDAQERGWVLDPTGDIARVLRIPGTTNHNHGAPLPVGIVHNGGRRYTLAELRAALAANPPTITDDDQEQLDLAAVKVRLNAKASPPPAKLAELLTARPAFAKVWAGVRRAGWSASEYDLSLASFAARAGWADQEIADLLVGGRRARGDDLDLGNRQKYQRTIAKVRAEVAGAGSEDSGDSGNPASSPAKVFYTAAELRDHQSPDIDWVIEGILGRGLFTVMAGKPKCGKTTMAVGMLWAAINGRQFVGLATKPCRVLYITEQNATTITPKLAEYGLLDSSDVSVMVARSLLGAPWEGVVAAARAYALEHEITTVVVDTVNDLAHLEDENSPALWLAALDPLQRMAHDDGLAVMAVQHAKKDAAASLVDMVRGSGAVAGKADILFGMWRDGSGSETVRTIESMSRIESEHGFGDRTRITREGCEYVTTGTMREIAKQTKLAEVLAVLPTSQPDAITRQAVAEALGWPASTTGNHLRDLVSDGRAFVLELPGNRKLYWAGSGA